MAVGFFSRPQPLLQNHEEKTNTQEKINTNNNKRNEFHQNTFHRQKESNESNSVPFSGIPSG